MPKRVRTGLTRSDILDRYVERFKQQLVKFQPFLSRKRGSASLEDFDEAAEELIGQVFGAASDESEAYFFAKTGESALLPERRRRAEPIMWNARASNNAGKYWKAAWLISSYVADCRPQEKKRDRTGTCRRVYVA